MKRVKFLGDSLEALRLFPDSARRAAGFQLDRVQQGLDPEDWKPMTSVGPGVREIRVEDEQGIYRVMYVAKFERAIYVLHCFQKKTQKTSAPDIDLVRRRYKEIEREQLQ